MIERTELMELCNISGFKVDVEQQEKLFLDMAEIIGIMDKINEFQENLDYVLAPASLNELREDKPIHSAILKAEDISVGRVVQSDD